MYAFILFLMHLFGPSPPIIVARDTTYLTEPLTADGLPDYERYTLDRNRKGATRQNNAAVLIWQALWPNDLDSRDYESMGTELGFKHLPSPGSALELVFGKENQKRAGVWWRTQNPNAKDFDHYEVIGAATDIPWTSREFPPMAEWARANQKPLDLIVEASRRPRFYSPSPTLLDEWRNLLVAIQIPGTHNMREAARALRVRAMWHVGENRLDDAWLDLMAIHRLARLTAQCHTVVEQYVAMSLSSIACDGTLVLLSNNQLTLRQARQAEKDLNGMKDFNRINNCLDISERLETLDVLIVAKVHGIDRLSGDPRAIPRVLTLLPFDWNGALRRVNKWFDRLVAIAEIPTHKDRARAYKQFDADLESSSIRAKRPIRLLIAFFSSGVRGETIGDIVTALMLTGPHDAIQFEERTNTNLHLTRIATALAVYRLEHRAYPKNLRSLVPAHLKKMPVDLYNNKSLVYKRTDDGYLLYSAGGNGVDDGGSHQEWEIFKGQSLEELKNSDPQKAPPQIPAGADDISIRVPRPEFMLPKARTTAN